MDWHVNKDKQGHERESGELIEKLLEINPAAKTMLDIGCGIGTTLRAGEKLGLKCSGVEPNPFACEYAKSHHDLDIVNGYFSSKDFSSGFDIILLDQVLEHVPNPNPFMKEVFSVLNPSGILYFSVPGNKGGIVRVLFSLLAKENNKSIFKDNDVHINHFFPKSIRFLSDSNSAQILRKVKSGTYVLRKD